MGDTIKQGSWFGRHKVLTAGIVIFLLALYSIGSQATKDAANKAVSTTSSSPTAEAPQNPSYGVKEDVRVGDVRWTVNKVYTTDKLQGLLGPETAQGKYVVVNVTVENLGQELKTVNGLSLVDDHGRKFIHSSDTFQGLGATQLYILENINPNVPYTFADAYEVPKDAKGLKLIVGELGLLGTKQAMINLGI